MGYTHIRTWLNCTDPNCETKTRAGFLARSGAGGLKMAKKAGWHIDLRGDNMRCPACAQRMRLSPIERLRDWLRFRLHLLIVNEL